MQKKAPIIIMAVSVAIVVTLPFLMWGHRTPEWVMVVMASVTVVAFAAWISMVIRDRRQRNGFDGGPSSRR